MLPLHYGVKALPLHGLTERNCSWKETQIHGTRNVPGPDDRFAYLSDPRRPDLSANIPRIEIAGRIVEAHVMMSSERIKCGHFAGTWQIRNLKSERMTNDET